MSKLMIDYNGKDIRKDLKRLGIDANVGMHTVSNTGAVLSKYWIYEIVFYTQEDMNLYRLLGNYQEEEFYIRHILCSKR